jgi:hypothetical protein
MIINGNIYIIHGPADKTDGNPYSYTASYHDNDDLGRRVHS